MITIKVECRLSGTANSLRVRIGRRACAYEAAKKQRVRGEEGGGSYENTVDS